jgi:hypothetical protein
MFLGPVSLVVLAIVLAVILVPIAQIIHKAGYSRIWILVWFVPFVNLIFLWVFAFSRWPNQGDRT